MAHNSPVVEGIGIVRFEPDGLAVKAQLFINVGGSKPSLEPLLGSQLFFLDRRSRVGSGFLFRRRSPCGNRCRMQHSSQRHIQIPVAQASHGLEKVLRRDAHSVVLPE
jgi:hypothetical protein